MTVAFSHEVCSRFACDETPVFMAGVYKPEEHDIGDSAHYHTCREHLLDVVEMLVDGGHLVLVESHHD